MTTAVSQPEVFVYDPGEFWDEMFAAPGAVRPFYAPLAAASAAFARSASSRAPSRSKLVSAASNSSLAEAVSPSDPSARARWTLVRAAS